MSTKPSTERLWFKHNHLERSVMEAPFCSSSRNLSPTVFCVNITTLWFVNMSARCLLPSRCRCDLQSRVLWILASRWVSGTRKDFPTVSKRKQKHMFKPMSKRVFYSWTCLYPDVLLVFAGATPACKSCPFPTGESCPTVTHLYPSLAWTVCRKTHKHPHLWDWHFPERRINLPLLLAWWKEPQTLTFSCRWRIRACLPEQSQCRTGPSSPSPRCSSFLCHWDGKKIAASATSWSSSWG